MSSRLKARLLDIMQREGNSTCADCGTELVLNDSPDQNTNWASYNLGVFLCVDCASIHRMLGAHISRVKSIQLDQWNEDQVDFMDSHGNEIARKTYEQMVPPAYRRPSTKDCQVIKEQWIRAKYERNEFMDPEKQSYLSGTKTGYLFKRGKEDPRFQKRLFKLNEAENNIMYFNKQDAEKPKAIIRLSDLNAVFVPDKIGNPNGLQLTYVTDGTTRNIYLYTHSGQDIIDWYTAIRHANYNRLKIAYPDKSDAQLCSQLTHDFTKEGYLCKTGPKGSEGYKKRWFTLDRRHLTYYNDPLDANPLKIQFIGNNSDKFAAREGVPPGVLDQGFSFTLVTPDREYYLSAETETDKKQWMAAFKRLIDSPVSPQEYNKSLGR